MTAYEPVDVRFWRRVDKSGPRTGRLGRCWLWTGAFFSTPRQYGQIAVHSRPKGAHVIAWQIAEGRPLTGETPKGKVIRHKCDNPSCVRPSHMTLGTPFDNFADSVRRGRRSLKVTDAMVRRIRANPPKYGQARVLARRLGISEAQVSRIVNGKQRRREITT